MSDKIQQAYQACKQGELDTLKQIIQEHKIFNDELLMTAAEFGHLNIVHYLIDHKISYIHYMHDLVLCRAAKSGNIELIDTLIQKGCDVHNNKNPLSVAALNGHLKLVQHLVEHHHCDIHAGNNDALIYAATHGQLPVVQYLIQKGANIHALNDQIIYDSATYQCEIHANCQVVEYLLDLDVSFFKHVPCIIQELNEQLTIFKRTYGDMDFYYHNIEIMIELLKRKHFEAFKLDQLLPNDIVLQIQSYLY